MALAAWLLEGNRGQTDSQAQLPDGTSLAGGVGPSWRQATVSGSDKQHLNAITD